MNLMTNIIRGFLDSQQQSLTSQLIMRGDNNFFTHFSAFKVITQQQLQNDVHLNQIVFVNNQEALVKFIGTVHFGAGLFYGVEVPFGSGCTNGTEGGVAYFSCPENSGMFLKFGDFQMQKEDEKEDEDEL
ncbi:CAP-Gly_domain-containing linker protein [Hexamita inflata]|uniref:CAP-Gly domain-containing linker protein n=1 Tax=Hexamita inflata TaxID=28002 RepID=A0AA86S5G9_9EUKA|nr:CAP-Gly domain-containing linker protein [Hexamita inflata]